MAVKKRMENSMPIIKLIHDGLFTKADVINMGIDICSELCTLEKEGIVHFEITEDNILKTQKGSFLIGNFSKTVNLNGQNEICKVNFDLDRQYLAPEILKNAENYNKDSALYSLAIILFKLLNYGRIPYLPKYPEKLSKFDINDAIEKRIEGENIFFAPVIAGDKLGEVLVKACSFFKVDRFATASSFKETLEKVKKELSKKELSEIIKIEKIMTNEVFNVKCSNDILNPSSMPKDKDRKAIIRKVENKTIFKSIPIRIAVIVFAICIILGGYYYITNMNKIHYPNGILYEGRKKNGEPIGEGKLIFKDGSTFTGNWDSGKVRGEFSKGLKYEGGMLNGLKQGKGIAINSAGKKYEGEFKFDKKEGHGTFTTNTGYKYEGEWKNDMSEGIGTEILENGTKYEGEWFQDKKKGKGKQILRDGTTYEGNWEKDMKSGYGILTLPDGTKFSGQFKNDLLNGEGIQQNKDGSEYRGQFENGFKNGKGIMKFSDGTTKQGEWSMGLLVK